MAALSLSSDPLSKDMFKSNASSKGKIRKSTEFSLAVKIGS